MRQRRLRRRAGTTLGLALVAATAVVVVPPTAVADDVPGAVPFTQDWTATAQISVNDDWSGVPGIVGYLGDNVTALTGADPQTLTGAAGGAIDVIANQTNTGIANGGVAEFELADPVVALNGSGTADAPSIVVTLDTTGFEAITVGYRLRDIDSSVDNSVQPVALQVRTGTTADFSNVPDGFVADASAGPSLTLDTAVSAVLPAAADGQPVVQIRIITANAAGNDEWIGIDDLTVTGTPAAGGARPVATCPTTVTTVTGTPASAAVSASDADDAVVTAVATVTPAHAGITLQDVVPASAAGTSLTARLDVAAGTTPGTYQTDVVFTNDDTTEPQSTTCRVTVTVEPPPSSIAEVQGAAHRSPLVGQRVNDVEGIVTVRRSNGFWFQDPTPDADPATSEGLFVFTGAAPTVVVGDLVLVDGTVTEFRAGGAGGITNLSLTELTAPSVTIVSAGNPLPPATDVGIDRIPPGEVIDDDATGSVETSGSFDAATDGIDFWESMESMIVSVPGAIAVGPTNGFGEIPVIAPGGAALRTPRGGIIARADDFNPERVLLDDTLIPNLMPAADVEDLLGDPAGPLDYSFGTFKLFVTSVPTVTDGGLAKESAAPVTNAERLAVATLNVENLSPADPATKFATVADEIVHSLGAPDLLSLEEVQDDTGPVNDGVVTSGQTMALLLAAITAAGGPTYEYRSIDPADLSDGGQPGGNIRQVFLFRTDRGLQFVDRPGGDAVTATAVVSGADGPELSLSPGRLNPTDVAFNASRKPLAGEFSYNGRTLFVVSNHFNSKGGDQPLNGQFQPPLRSTEVQRNQQAQVVNDFVDTVLADDPSAAVVVMGDLNDFPWSTALATLQGGVLTNLYDLLPEGERYSYVFEGNSQALDHILTTGALLDGAELDVVHVNSEFADQASDHDPVRAVLSFPIARPIVSITGPGAVNEGAAGAPGTASFTVSLDRDPTFPVTVEVTTADGSAGEPGDYAAVATSLTFEPGGPLSAVVTVTLVGDDVPEADETFSVSITTADTYATVDPLAASAIATITNDDGPMANVAILPTAQVEGRSGTRTMTFLVVMDRRLAVPASFGFATIGGTATAGVDYVATSGTLVIPAGAQVGTITVTIRGDRVREPAETVRVRLSSPVAAVLVHAEAVGVILDDD